MKTPTTGNSTTQFRVTSSAEEHPPHWAPPHQLIPQVKFPKRNFSLLSPFSSSPLTVDEAETDGGKRELPQFSPFYTGMLVEQSPCSLQRHGLNPILKSLILN